MILYGTLSKTNLKKKLRPKKFWGLEIKTKSGQTALAYELTTSQAKQVLVRESKSVRKAVIAYIEKLESELKKLSVPQTYAQALLEAGRLQLALEEKEALLIETQEVLEEKTTQLDESKEWFSMKRVAMLTGKSVQKFSWRKLKNDSDYLGYEVKKIFDANYGQVNTYHKDIWAIVYPETQKAIGYKHKEI